MGMFYDVTIGDYKTIAVTATTARMALLEALRHTETHVLDGQASLENGLTINIKGTGRYE